MPEQKKYRNAQLQRYKALFFNIGLVAALTFVLAAFEYKYHEPTKELSLNASSDDFEEIFEVPISKQPPPPPPSNVKEINLVEIEDEEEIEEEIEVQLDIDMTEEMRNEELFEILEEVPEEEVDSDQIFQIVEQAPIPIGGFDAFNRYVVNNLKYPDAARRLGIEGKVFVSFVVDENGDISNAMIMKGIHKLCDEEALRVVANAPDWNPGKQRGRAVKVRVTVPLNFTLGQYDY